jgi:hypothetical protein
VQIYLSMDRADQAERAVKVLALLPDCTFAVIPEVMDNKQGVAIVHA